MAAFPGANGWIAYSFETVGPSGTDIFTVLPDGSDMQRLTNDPGSEIDPSWSADGQRIVFVDLSERAFRLYTMNADGSERAAVGARGTSPSFSPSGRRIVFTTADAIRSVRTDGSGQRTLLRAPRQSSGHRCCLYDAVYSPNGERIAFAGVPTGEPGVGIWTMRRDGSGLRRLTHPVKPEYDDSPDFSPDGRQIVFRRFRRLGPTIFVMRANGSRERALPGQPAYAYDPVYAPAGDQIAGLRAIRSGPHRACSDLFTISSVGSEPRVITNSCEGGYGPFVGSPSWQPLGSPAGASTPR